MCSRRGRARRLPKGLLRDMQAGGPKREVALQMTTDAMLARFDAHQILAPDPARPPQG